MIDEKCKKLQLSLLFQDHMVLQRDKKIAIWGEGIPQHIVKAKIQGKQWECVVESDGKWRIEIGSLHTAVDETLELISGEEKIYLQDIAVGEIWIAGGQSNMEFQMKYEAHYAEELPDCKDHLLRFFDYPEVSYEGELEEKQYLQDGFWRRADNNELAYFSAVAYYFGKKLRCELNVPVGLVGCNWGGTTASAWMHPCYLEQNEGRIWLEEYQTKMENFDEADYEEKFSKSPDSNRTDLLNNPLHYGMLDHEVGLEELKGMYELLVNGKGTELPIGPKWPGRPGGLYETMLKKIAPYGIRGVIWYQGESDAEKGEKYETVFEKLIQCWRMLWQEEFPFLFVQLAPFEGYKFMGGSQYPIIRECQQRIADKVNNTGMAVITDAGMRYDIHPKNKRPVGERLALHALKNTYAKAIACEAPRMVKGAWEAGRLMLTFAHDGNNLVFSGDFIDGLEIRQDWERISSYKVCVHGNQLEISAEQIDSSKVTQIDLACKDYYQINLYNDAGLPARPGHLIIEPVS